MLTLKDILITQDMIDKRHLDIRTITMGISLLDCAHYDSDLSDPSVRKGISCCGTPWEDQLLYASDR